MQRSSAVTTTRRTPRTASWVAALLCVSCGTLSAPAMADAVTDWNVFIDTLAPQPPPIRSRIQAMMQLAIHDALNSISPRYESYNDVPPASAQASPDVAVAAAARAVLLATMPASQYAAIEAFYAAATGSCAVGCSQGATAGIAAANAMLDARATDGSATPHLPYSAPVVPGLYQPTPRTPALLSDPELPPIPPQFAGWALVTPFVMRSGSQFQADPSPIFDLTSEEYTQAFNEVKRVGARDASPQDRTADQSEVARFWPGGGANINAVARAIVANRGLDPWEHARLFALINAALNDAAVAVFDTKYTYNFWRPVTAIRAAATDGNPSTEPDATWLSYQNTPPYPDYTCGLTTQTGAGMEVIRRYFGTDDLPYTLTVSLGGVPTTRGFASLSAAEAEAVDARVFGGMHFRAGCVRGIIGGNQVGRFVIQHSLQALKPSRGKPN